MAPLEAARRAAVSRGVALRRLKAGGRAAAQIWDCATGLLVGTCKGHMGPVNCVDIDKLNMKWIISGGRGKYIKVRAAPARGGGGARPGGWPVYPT